MKDLKDIKFWLFDLDNTLYDGATKVFDQVDKKMSKFISEKLNVSIEEARKIQKNYFQEYNTTLNGMIKHHKIDADEFLEFVHDVDLSFLNKDKDLEDFEEDLMAESPPNTADAMKRYKAGKAGFTDIAHLKAKGLIARSDGEKRKSDKYK